MSDRGRNTLGYSWMLIDVRSRLDSLRTNTLFSLSPSRSASPWSVPRRERFPGDFHRGRLNGGARTGAQYNANLLRERKLADGFQPEHARRESFDHSSHRNTPCRRVPGRGGRERIFVHLDDGLGQKSGKSTETSRGNHNCARAPTRGFAPASGCAAAPRTRTAGGRQPPKTA